MCPDSAGEWSSLRAFSRWESKNPSAFSVSSTHTCPSVSSIITSNDTGRTCTKARTLHRQKPSPLYWSLTLTFSPSFRSQPIVRLILPDLLHCQVRVIYVLFFKLCIQPIVSQTWWRRTTWLYTSIISALRWQNQDDIHKFKDRLVYLISSKSVG